jgi:hypothetical protein
MGAPHFIFAINMSAEERNDRKLRARRLDLPLERGHARFEIGHHGLDFGLGLAPPGLER